MIWLPEIRGLASGSAYGPIAAPDELPGAKCLRLTTSEAHSDAAQFRCSIPHGRYVEVIISDSRSDMEKKASAACALLANSMQPGHRQISGIGCRTDV